jgi:hypothetical protein
LAEPRFVLGDFVGGKWWVFTIFFFFGENMGGNSWKLIEVIGHDFFHQCILSMVMTWGMNPLRDRPDMGCNLGRFNMWITHANGYFDDDDDDDSCD